MIKGFNEFETIAPVSAIFWAEPIFWYSRRSPAESLTSAGAITVVPDAITSSTSAFRPESLIEKVI